MDTFLEKMRQRQALCWLNPDYEQPGEALPCGLGDILAAEARLFRFAPLLAELFEEAAEQFGVIESRLLDIPRLGKELLPGGKLLLKADHDLPVAGSVKARGGIYNVLCFAEEVCLKAGVLSCGENYRKINTPAIRELLGRYTVSVGSTGNLGLSIGTIAAALGFKAKVHMSCEAKEWKKQLLRSRGVEVIEHAGDYSAAVAQGRKESQMDPFSYFVDDENSMELFLGYSVAALRLRDQLRLRQIFPDKDNPLFVYLPCGVGGAPGGICFGLKMIFKEAVHCFFAEPVDVPCMALGLATGKNDAISVYDIGLTNKTIADGLAVARPSSFVGKLMKNLLAGCITLTDERMEQFRQQAKTLENLKIEPSAAAGFAGPEMVLSGDFCRLRKIDPARVTHILWTTGGRYLPE